MDFQHVSFDLTFNASSPAQTVMVPILDDMTVDNFEYFSLVLMSNDPAVTLNPVAANITVVDDLDSTLKQQAANITVVDDLDSTLKQLAANITVVDDLDSTLKQLAANITVVDDLDSTLNH